MKKIRTILILFFLLLLILSAYKFVSVFKGYREGRESYTALVRYISFGEVAESQHSVQTAAADVTAAPEADPTAAASAIPEAITGRIPSETIMSESQTSVGIALEPSISPFASVVPETTASPINWPEVNFDQLRAINPDIVGWIYIEGTHINYPIVQAKDNEYYLKRMFDGKRNSAGCIFLDYRCVGDFTDLHNVLYGHHMKDDSMFADLELYKDPAFYDEHPTALLITPTHKYRIALFSSYVANNKDDSWQLNFGQQEFEAWLRDKIKRSGFEANSCPDGDENILTLSTCTYDYNGAKYILHGFVAETIANEA